MKSLLCALGIATVVLNPAYAEDMCREQARAVGYVGALEMLEPCPSQPIIAVLQAGDGGSLKESKTKNEPPSVAQVDRSLKR